MNPMDDALLDRLARRAARGGRKGRSAKQRLEQLIKRRIRMAEDAVLNPRLSLKQHAEVFKEEWVAGFAKLKNNEDLKIYYAKSDAHTTAAFFEHFVKPPRAL